MAEQTAPTKSTTHDLSVVFWTAPNEALLSRPTTAAGIGYSVSWLELKATRGGGPRMTKIGRRVLYRKVDVLAWLEINSRTVNHTSELEA